MDLLDTFHPFTRSNIRTKLHESVQDPVIELVGLYSSLHNSLQLQDDSGGENVHLIRESLHKVIPVNGLLWHTLSKPEDSPTFYKRLVILTILCDMMLSFQHRGDINRITSYLESLKEFVTHQKLHISPCLWALTWTLMVRPHGFHMDNPPRIWLAARVLWTAKRLPQHFVQRLEQALFSLLLTPSTIDAYLDRDSTPPRLDIWDPEEFAAALWEALGQ
jgi:hypothetical protein